MIVLVFSPLLGILATISDTSRFRIFLFKVLSHFGEKKVHFHENMLANIFVLILFVILEEFSSADSLSICEKSCYTSAGASQTQFGTLSPQRPAAI